MFAANVGIALRDALFTGAGDNGFEPGNFFLRVGVGDRCLSRKMFLDHRGEFFVFVQPQARDDVGFKGRFFSAPCK